MLVNGDRVGEPEEYFSVNPVGGTPNVHRGSGAAGVIADDEPRLGINSVTVTEGNSGTVAATFTLTLSATYDAPVTVGYSTTDAPYYPGVATAGVDYQQVTGGTVTIPAGARTQTLTVLVNADRVAEFTEYFSVRLGSAAGALITTDTGSVTILDDDPHLTVADARVVEGNSGVTYLDFTVTLSAAPTDTVTVRYATQNGSAASGTDYLAASGTLTFSPTGPLTQTIRVTVYGDEANEGDEYVYLALSNLTGNALLYDDFAYGVIANDDARRGKGGKK